MTRLLFAIVFMAAGVMVMLTVGLEAWQFALAGIVLIAIGFCLAAEVIRRDV